MPRKVISISGELASFINTNIKDGETIDRCLRRMVGIPAPEKAPVMSPAPRGRTSKYDVLADLELHESATIKWLRNAEHPEWPALNANAARMGVIRISTRTGFQFTTEGTVLGLKVTRTK